MSGIIEFPGLMRTSDVAAAFGVASPTVTRWSRDGKLTSVRTPGGHRRYIRCEVEALLAGRPLTEDETAMLAWLTGGQP